MLKKLRHKKTAKWIWIVLAVLILPAFVFWGFGSYVRGKQEAGYAGKIFGRRIPFTEYRDAYEAVRTQAVIQFGENLSEVQKLLNFESQAWERLIMLHEARRNRIKISDQEVVGLIQSYPFFQRKGRFDERVYAQVLQFAFGTQPRIFEEQARQNLMIARLYQAATAPIRLTDAEIAEEYRKANEELSVFYIASSPSENMQGLAASDEELRDYFEKNSLKFKQPLSFNIEYVSLAPAGDNKGDAEETVKDIFGRLARKQEFAQIAKELSLPVTETGFFGENDPIPGIGWSPQVASLLAKIKPGEFLPPVILDKKYHVIRLKERKEPRIPEFEAIKEKVKEVFLKDKATVLARQRIEECLKVLRETRPAGRQPDFEQAARGAGLATGATPLFKYGSYIEKIGASDDLWTAAQKIKPDEFSDIVETSSGFYVVRLKERIPVDENKFSQEKEEFSRRLLAQKKQVYFSRFVEELKAKAQRY